MDLQFFVKHEVLTDESVVYNVVAREDEDDEDEPEIMIWRAPSSVAANMMVAVLTEVGAEFKKCNSDSEYSALAALYISATV